MIVNLPSRGWFYQPQGNRIVTNIYTGSLGTDPLIGCMNHDIFCFKVLIEGEGKEPLFKAECYVQHTSKSGIKIFSVQEKVFGIAKEDFKALNQWLDNQYLLYKKKQ